MERVRERGGESGREGAESVGESGWQEGVKGRGDRLRGGRGD